MLSTGCLTSRHCTLGRDFGPSHKQRIATPYPRTRMSAAPSTIAPEATQQLTKEDLVKYLASGCKPREKWRYDNCLILLSPTLRGLHVGIGLQMNGISTKDAVFHAHNSTGAVAPGCVCKIVATRILLAVHPCCPELCGARRAAKNLPKNLQSCCK